MGYFYMGNTTVTDRLDTETKKKLELLSKTTARSKSFLISEVVRVYLKEQAWQIDAIGDGIDQADVENFASNNEIKSTSLKWGEMSKKIKWLRLALTDLDKPMVYIAKDNLEAANKVAWKTP
jgi:predicted transcriptional regulator